MKRYIGNKTKLLPEIDNFLVQNNITSGTFLDLYAGTGSVSNYFKDRFIVSANDIMLYSYYTCYTKLTFNETPKFEEFHKHFNQSPFDYLNTTNERIEGLFHKHFSPSANRFYFTSENALMIDTARTLIDDWKENNYISNDEWVFILSSILSNVSSKGNTSGTFAAFFKTFTSSTKKKIIWTPLEVSKGHTGVATCKDGLQALEDSSFDLLYLDPPYTSVDYSQVYHLLETLSLYKEIEFTGITGRRSTNKKTSKYTKKNLAWIELETTIKKAKGCKNVLLSYSNHGIIPESKILSILNQYYKKVIHKRVDYKTYRTHYANQKGPLQEWLFLAKERKK